MTFSRPSFWDFGCYFISLFSLSLFFPQTHAHVSWWRGQIARRAQACVSDFAVVSAQLFVSWMFSMEKDTLVNIWIRCQIGCTRKFANLPSCSRHGAFAGDAVVERRLVEESSDRFVTPTHLQLRPPTARTATVGRESTK